MRAFPSILPEPDFTPLRGGPTLRWGVLAPGSIADAWVTTLHANTDQRVAAVASRTLARAEEFAWKHNIDRSYGDYEQLVADPGVDVIYIAAPHSEHLRLALLAIGAGKHVLVEKPMATNVNDTRAIVDAARDAGLFAMEAMWSRFLPQTTVMKRLMTDGVLGDVHTASADFGVKFEFDATSRMFDPALGGGALLDLGVYPAWFVHFALGAPKSVTATGTLASTGVDAQSAVISDYESGAQSTMTTSMYANTPTVGAINGSLARIEVAGFVGPGSFRLVAGSDSLDWKDSTGFEWRDGLCYQATAVAQHISDGLEESPLHSLDDTLEIAQVLESARRQLGAL